jgi:hypothetical protein
MSKAPNRSYFGIGILKGYASDSAYLSAVGTAKRGDIYYNTTLSILRYYDGVQFRSIQNSKNRAVVRLIDFILTNTPSGPQTIDGVSTNTGDYVVLANHSTIPGIYKVETGLWTLVTEELSDPSGNPQNGDSVFVTAGNVYSGNTFTFLNGSWISKDISDGTVNNSLLTWDNINSVWSENPTVISNLGSIETPDNTVNNSSPASTLILKAGDKTAGTGDGGGLNITAGNSVAGNGGNINIAAGSSTSGNSGNVAIKSGETTVSTVVNVAQRSSSGTLRTIQTSGPHNFINGNAIIIAGVGTEYDGTYNITVVNATTFTYTDPNSYNEPTTASGGTATQNEIVPDGRIDLFATQLGLGGVASDTDPTNADQGDIYYNTTELRFKYYDGTQWRAIGGGGGLIRVRLYDPVSTVLPTGNPVTLDGVNVQAGNLVLFSNLTSNNNRIYKANGTGQNITSWTAQPIFANGLNCVDGEAVIVTEGNSFADQIGKFDGTDWVFNDKVRYFNGTDYWEQSSIYTTTLLNNQPTPQDVFSVNFLGSENLIVDFSIKRGTTKETGTLHITTDGSTVSVARTGATISSNGIVFDAQINGSNLKVTYTSSNTGSNADMKFIIRRWSDGAGGPGGPPSYTGGGGGSVNGTGANGRLAFWNGVNTISSNANFTLDTANDNIGLSGLKLDILKSVTLLDNQPVTNIFTIPHADYKFIVVEYSIERNNNFRVGRLLITSDGVLASYTDDNTAIGSDGITLSVDVLGPNIRVRYTSTNTGNNATFKYALRKWI